MLYKTYPCPNENTMELNQLVEEHCYEAVHCCLTLHCFPDSSAEGNMQIYIIYFYNL